MELTLNTEKTEGLYLHQNILSGECDDFKYSLSCGAGLGHDKLIFYIRSKNTGEIIREIVSLDPVFRTWIKNKIEELKITRNETRRI